MHICNYKEGRKGNIITHQCPVCWDAYKELINEWEFRADDMHGNGQCLLEKKEGDYGECYKAFEEAVNTNFPQNQMAIAATATGKAMWFSRHAPTVEQVKEVREEFGCELVMHTKEDASLSIETEIDAISIAKSIVNSCVHNEYCYVFGVFATPILEIAMNTDPDDDEFVSLYAAWNVTRTPDGGKPTFHHKKFCRVGRLSLM